MRRAYKRCQFYYFKGCKQVINQDLKLENIRFLKNKKPVSRFRKN